MDPITGFLINLLIGVVLSLASSLVQSIFKQDQQQKVAGVRGTIQTGGDNSPSFIVGRYATAGKLKYAGTWGNDGETPNAYYSKVAEASFLPIRGYSGWFINGERVTLDASVTGDLGYAVLEYRDGAGKDHAWINPYLGDQTVADPLMRAKFGADPDRPYTAEMVGRGLGYFVATFLVNREFFAGLPEVLAEVDGIALDDPRGDDAHDNPIIAAYTLLKGLSYDGQWVYGPQSYSDYNFRLANIESEADKCDALRSLAGGGTEKRFRIGLEVALDAEPHAIVGEFLKGCQGRWADVGGVFKFLVGDPSAPVVSITDEDIVITEQQTFEPFPGLESLFNAMTATYPEPAEAWETKEAPPRYRSDLEASDDGRRLPFSTDYKAVPYAVQVQELMRAAIEETRRFRRHTMTMPPEFWEYEVLDVASWTSVRNGYEDKQFLITAMDDLPNVNQFVGVQEIDPADYDWDSDYELPYDVVPLVIARPAPQEIIGWDVAPYIFPDSAAEGRRIGIEVFYDEGLLDVRAVRVQVREDFGDNNLVFDGEFPYDPTELDPSRALTWAGIIPSEDYEVRGIYVPFSGRAVDWSGWLGVTTPPPQLSEKDFYPDLAGTLEVLNQGLEWLAQSNKRVRDDLQSVVVRLQDQGNTSEENFQQVWTKLTAERDILSTKLTADYDLKITTAVGVIDGQLVAQSSRIETLDAQIVDANAGITANANAIDAVVVTVTSQGGTLTAHGLAITAVETSVGDISADGKVKIESFASPGGGWSRVGIQARVSTGDVWTTAAILLDAKTDGTSRALLVADNVAVMDSGGNVAAMFDAGTTYIANARMANFVAAWAQIQSAVVGNFVATAANIGTAAITSAKIGDLEVDTIKINGTAIADDVVSSGTSGSVSSGSVPIYYYSTSFVATGKVLPYFCKYTFTKTGGTGQFAKWLRLHNVTTNTYTELDYLLTSEGVTNFSGLLTGLTTGHTYRLAHIGSYSDTAFDHTINWVSSVIVRKR